MSAQVVRLPVGLAQQIDQETGLLLGSVEPGSPAEHAEGFIAGALNIPLGELRQRLSEVPRDREIIAYCQSGQRSYLAARLLAQKGFRVRNLTGAYRTWLAARD